MKFTILLHLFAATASAGELAFVGEAPKEGFNKTMAIMAGCESNYLSSFRLFRNETRMTDAQVEKHAKWLCEWAKAVGGPKYTGTFTMKKNKNGKGSYCEVVPSVREPGSIVRLFKILRKEWRYGQEKVKC